MISALNLNPALLPPTDKEEYWTWIEYYVANLDAYRWGPPILEPILGYVAVYMFTLALEPTVDELEPWIMYEGVSGSIGRDEAGSISRELEMLKGTPYLEPWASHVSLLVLEVFATLQAYNRKHVSGSFFDDTAEPSGPVILERRSADAFIDRLEMYYGATIDEAYRVLPYSLSEVAVSAIREFLRYYLQDVSDDALVALLSDTDGRPMDSAPPAKRKATPETDSPEVVARVLRLIADYSGHHRARVAAYVARIVNADATFGGGGLSNVKLAKALAAGLNADGPAGGSTATAEYLRKLLSNPLRDIKPDAGERVTAEAKALLDVGLSDCIG